MQARYDHRNPAALVRLLEQGVLIRRFPDDLMRAARQTAFEMFEELAAAEATYRKVYTAWKKAYEVSLRWFGTAELAQASFTFSESGA